MGGGTLMKTSVKLHVDIKRTSGPALEQSCVAQTAGTRFTADRWRTPQHGMQIAVCLQRLLGRCPSAAIWASWAGAVAFKWFLLSRSPVRLSDMNHFEAYAALLLLPPDAVRAAWC